MSDTVMARTPKAVGAPAWHRLQHAEVALELAVYSDLGAIESEWRRFQEDADCSVFQTFDWLAAWAGAVAPAARYETAIVVGRIAGGATLFIFPFAIATGPIRRLSWLGSELCDYNGPLLGRDMPALFGPERFAELWQEILARLQSDRRTRFDLIELVKMPERIGAQANPLVNLRPALNPSNAYITDLFGTWEEFYREKRSSATRRRDRTKLKRLGEWGEVRFVTPAEPAEIEQTMQRLFEQKSRLFARMGVPDIFARPGWREFFLRLAREPNVHASRLDIGGTWSAINFGIVFRDTYHHVLASYDDGALAQYGPGVAHLRELLRHAIERGLRHFDFTIGDERYKREWSDRTIALYDLVAGASLRGHAVACALDGWRGLKRTIKQNATLWSFVSRLRSKLGGRAVAPAPPAGRSPPLAPE